MATAKATKEMVEIKPIEVKRVKARLVGDTPLIVHTWDDTKAAENYREWQARRMISAIEIVSTDAVGGGMVEIEPVLPTRAFHALRTGDSEGYESIGQIMSDEEKMERLLELAKKDAQIFKMKYGHLQKLSKLITAIDETFGEGA